ncbi:DEAD-box type RNA helicase [Sorochytrium milnesiophthora]
MSPDLAARSSDLDAVLDELQQLLRNHSNDARRFWDAYGHLVDALLLVPQQVDQGTWRGGYDAGKVVAEVVERVPECDSYYDALISGSVSPAYVTAGREQVAAVVECVAEVVDEQVGAMPATHAWMLGWTVLLLNAAGSVASAPVPDQQQQQQQQQQGEDQDGVPGFGTYVLSVLRFLLRLQQQDVYPASISRLALRLLMGITLRYASAIPSTDMPALYSFLDTHAQMCFKYLTTCFSSAPSPGDGQARAQLPLDCMAQILAADCAAVEDARRSPALVILSTEVWTRMFSDTYVLRRAADKHGVVLVEQAWRVLRLPPLGPGEGDAVVRDAFGGVRTFVANMLGQLLEHWFSPDADPGVRKRRVEPLLPYIPWFLTSDLPEVRIATTAAMERAFGIKSLAAVRKHLLLGHPRALLQHAASMFSELTDYNHHKAPMLMFLYPANVLVRFLLQQCFGTPMGLAAESPGFATHPEDREQLVILWLASWDYLASVTDALLRVGRQLDEGTDESAIFDTTQSQLFLIIGELLSSTSNIFSVLNVSKDPDLAARMDADIMLGDPLNTLIAKCAQWLKVYEVTMRNNAFRFIVDMLNILLNKVGPHALEMSTHSRLELVATDQEMKRTLLTPPQRQLLFTRLSAFSAAQSPAQPSERPLDSVQARSKSPPPRTTAARTAPSTATTTAAASTTTERRATPTPASTTTLTGTKKYDGIVVVVEPPAARSTAAAKPATSESAFDSFSKVWKQADKARGLVSQSKSSPVVPSRGFPIGAVRKAAAAATSAGSAGLTSRSVKTTNNYHSSSKLGQLRAEFARERGMFQSGPLGTSNKRAVHPPPKPRRPLTSEDDSDEDVGLAELAEDTHAATTTATTREPKVVDLDSARDRLKQHMANKKKVKTIDQHSKDGYAQSSALGRLNDKHQNGGPHVVADMSTFDKQVLCWDWFGEGPRPMRLSGKRADLPLRKVPAVFQTVREYMEVFEPLLYLETWQQLQTSREEANMLDVVRGDLLDLASVDDFVHLKLRLPFEQAQDKHYSENDLVHLYSDEQAIDKNRPTIYMLAKVLSASIRGEFKEVVLAVHLADDPRRLRDCLRPNSKWNVLILFSLTTMHREYRALLELAYTPLRENILKGVAEESAIPSSQSVETVQRSFQLNKPQAEAVLHVLNRPTGLTLIQGPPGTGKTKTILGLLGSLLSKPITNEGIPIVNSPLAFTTEHILVCAPSNAAVDELTRRIKRGLKNYHGEAFRPRIVRLGASEAIHRDAKAVTLDELVENMLASDYATDMGNAKQNLEEADEAFAQLLEDRRVLNLDKSKIEEQLANASDAEQIKNLENQLRSLNTRRREMTESMDSEKMRKTDSSKMVDGLRMRIRMKLLNEAQIVTCTLSSAGHDVFSKMNHAFDVVIVDEAAQSVELSSLIPLKYGCKKCVLVGDPNQLPPTVVSQLAQEYMYEQSLFVRVQAQSPNAVHLLSIQYRMHPEISHFPSKIFYDSRLEDGVTREQQTVAWHRHDMFGPFRFFNVYEGKERSSRVGHSLFNVTEVELIVDFVRHLCHHNPDINFTSRIGVITPYKQQLRELRNHFIRRFGRQVLESIDVNTIDGFQGQEKDIIILSCVRAGEDKGIGFLSDVRRMNVGLTRARHSLFIFGHSESLKGNRYWRQLIQHAHDKDLHTDVSTPLFGKAMAGPLPKNLLPIEYQPSAESRASSRAQSSYAGNRTTTPPSTSSSSTKRPSSSAHSGNEPSKRRAKGNGQVRQEWDTKNLVALGGNRNKRKIPLPSRSK